MKPNKGIRVNCLREKVMLKVQANNLGAVAVLRLEGQIVNGETDSLRSSVQSLADVSAVKLDLARVTIVDAGGLGVMLQLREQVEAKGIRFELMNVTKRISMLLELTRLDTVFRITPGVEFFPAVTRSPRASLAPGARLASCA